MGYEKINLYGTSYGTRVSLAYINKYPKKVRTATLKGLVPYDLAIPFEFAENAQRSLDILIKDCKDNQACNSTYPHFEKELITFFNNQFPIVIELTNPETHKKETIELSKEIIALNLRVLLMSPSTTNTIPFLITQFNKGNYEPLASTILAIKKSYLKGLYDGMTLCVVCNEDYPALSRITVKEKSETFLGNYWIYRIMNSCKIWNSKRKESMKMPVRKQDIPVLLISGNRDAATPPKYGDEVLKYFPNGKHIVIINGSHSFDGMRNCIENIICDFVITGQNQLLTTDCLDLIKSPVYKVN
jgi:pimeloyl-ACP methyl ester carboxylesterase